MVDCIRCFFKSSQQISIIIFDFPHNTVSYKYSSSFHIQKRIWISLLIKVCSFISCKSHMLIKSYCLWVLLIHCHFSNFIIMNSILQQLSANSFSSFLWGKKRCVARTDCSQTFIIFVNNLVVLSETSYIFIFRNDTPFRLFHLQQCDISQSPYLLLHLAKDLCYQFLYDYQIRFLHLSYSVDVFVHP